MKKKKKEKKHEMVSGQLTPREFTFKSRYAYMLNTKRLEGIPGYPNPFNLGQSTRRLQYRYIMKWITPGLHSLHRILAEETADPRWDWVELD